MKQETIDLLYEAWVYCDEEDKSTEFMIAYMQSAANVDHDTVMHFIMNYGGERRQQWYNNKNKQQ